MNKFTKLRIFKSNQTGVGFENLQKGGFLAQILKKL